MRYSKQEVMQYVQEEDVKFIRLSFCDVFSLMLQFAVDVLTLLNCNAALFNKGIEHFLRLFASDGHSANACQENIAETLFEFSSHDNPSISAR